MKHLVLLLSSLSASSCVQRADNSRHSRSDAVASTSQEMSGPSLFSQERLKPALAQLREKAGSSRLLRLEIGPREVMVQAEDPAHAGSVVELHYSDGRVSEAEHATLRGKGQLADNLFDLDEVKLGSLPELTRTAVERVDAENGSVELILVRRNLPDSDDVRLRVYVKSPRQSGYVDADRALTPL
jgi:hypothetical protein